MNYSAVQARPYPRPAVLERARTATCTTCLPNALAYGWCYNARWRGQPRVYRDCSPLTPLASDLHREKKMPHEVADRVFTQGPPAPRENVEAAVALLRRHRPALLRTRDDDEAVIDLLDN